jgi:hypothetical protein
MRNRILLSIRRSVGIADHPGELTGQAFREAHAEGMTARRCKDRNRGGTGYEICIPAILSLAAAATIAADDGSWGDFRGYTPAEGPLYSEAGNPDVALEKEYLELGDYKTGSTRAVFQFRNTAKKSLVVECAFKEAMLGYFRALASAMRGSIQERSTASMVLVPRSAGRGSPGCLSLNSDLATPVMINLMMGE